MLKPCMLVCRESIIARTRAQVCPSCLCCTQTMALIKEGAAAANLVMESPEARKERKKSGRIDKIFHSVAVVAALHQEPAATHMWAKCQKWGWVLLQWRRPWTANKPSRQDRQICTQVCAGVCPDSLIRGPSWADWQLIWASCSVLKETLPSVEKWAGRCSSGSPRVCF